jgi:hypothetical protein
MNHLNDAPQIQDSTEAAHGESSCCPRVSLDVFVAALSAVTTAPAVVAAATALARPAAENSLRKASLATFLAQQHQPPPTKRRRPGPPQQPPRELSGRQQNLLQHKQQKKQQHAISLEASNSPIDGPAKDGQLLLLTSKSISGDVDFSCPKDEIPDDGEDE